MKKLLKFLGYGLGGIFLLFLFAAIIFNERLPEPELGPEADLLAEKMQHALNVDAWKNTRYFQFSINNKRHYTWDKRQNIVNIRWDDNEVILDLDIIHGSAFSNGEKIVGKDLSEILEKAWSYWCKDSFWFSAPYKVMEEHVERGLITMRDGSIGLMTTFKEGGITPGDSFVWILDDQFRPVKWKMWAQIFPMGGVDATWDDWTTVSGGAQFAASHKSRLFKINLTNINGGNSLESLSLTESFFIIP